MQESRSNNAAAATKGRASDPPQCPFSLGRRVFSLREPENVHFPAAVDANGPAGRVHLADRLHGAADRTRNAKATTPPCERTREERSLLPLVVLLADQQIKSFFDAGVTKPTCSIISQGSILCLSDDCKGGKQEMGHPGPSGSSSVKCSVGECGARREMKLCNGRLRMKSKIFHVVIVRQLIHKLIHEERECSLNVLPEYQFGSIKCLVYSNRKRFPEFASERSDRASLGIKKKLGSVDRDIDFAVRPMFKASATRRYGAQVLRRPEEPRTPLNIPADRPWTHLERIKAPRRRKLLRGDYEPRPSEIPGNAACFLANRTSKQGPGNSVYCKIPILRDCISRSVWRSPDTDGSSPLAAGRSDFHGYRPVPPLRLALRYVTRGTFLGDSAGCRAGNVLPVRRLRCVPSTRIIVPGKGECSSYKARCWREVSVGKCQLSHEERETEGFARRSNMGPTLRSLILVAIAFSGLAARGKEKSAAGTPCIDDHKFYRNPNAPARDVWSPAECAKYYLCLENEVFEFRCSQGLLFDVSRQICDFKANVDNCDVTSETQPPRPLLEKGDCEEKHFACGDGTCFPAGYFCDGSVDCPDGSDEGWCDVRNDPNGASPCDPKKCQLPDCWCSEDGTLIPGNLTATAVPQMITITFDDAVNAENFELYSKIFSEDRKNPNGCPARGTFYISHQYTNYRDVQYLWNVGHEIAAHSVTHRGPEDWWAKNATIEDWFDEMIGVANIINKFAAVRLKDIKGLRAPFLRVGWNRQFLMMSEFGFVYDSSMLAPFSDPPLWPYTLDHKAPHDCVGTEQLCPTRAYPGLWELPLNQLLAGEYSCTRLDSCTSELSPEDVYKILMLNFKRHYLSNRAPFGLHLHSSWFQNSMYFYAFTKFMDDVLKLNDVYFVTSHQVIEWMRSPTPLSEIQRLWQCGSRQLQAYEVACDLPSSCKLPSRVLKSYRYLHTCFECPKEYPWLRNEFGLE